MKKTLTAILLLSSLWSFDAANVIHRRLAFRTGGGGSPASIEFEAAAASQAIEDDTSFTFNVSPSSAGDDGYVVVGIGCYDSDANADVSSVTFDGHSLAELTDTGYYATNFRGWLFGGAIGSETAGTKAVVITYTADMEETAAGASLYYNVHQTTSVGTAANATGTSTAATVNVSSATDEVVASHLYQYAGTPTIGADQTLRYTVSGTGDQSDARGSDEPGTTTTTASWTLASSHEWLMMAVPLKPAETEAVLTAVQTQGQTTDTSAAANQTGREFRGEQFTASWGSGDKEIAQISTRGYRHNNPSGTIRASIWTDSSGDPGAIIGDWSETVDASSLSASEQEIVFEILEANRPTLTHGTTYHLVLDVSSATHTFGDHVIWRFVGGSGSDDQHWSETGSGWSLHDGSSTATIILYAYE